MRNILTMQVMSFILLITVKLLISSRVLMLSKKPNLNWKNFIAFMVEQVKMVSGVASKKLESIIHLR